MPDCAQNHDRANALLGGRKKIKDGAGLALGNLNGREMGRLFLRKR